MKTIKEQAAFMKQQSCRMATQPGQKRNDALLKVAEALLLHQEDIIKENNIDLDQAVKDKIADPVLKRLKFDEEANGCYKWAHRACCTTRSTIQNTVKKRT